MDKFQRSLIKVQNTAYPLTKRYRHLTFLHGKAHSLANRNTHATAILSTCQSILQSSPVSCILSETHCLVCVNVAPEQSSEEKFNGILWEHYSPVFHTLWGMLQALNTQAGAKGLCSLVFFLSLSHLFFPHTVGPPLDDRT
jgi:hypothetical protein